MYHLSIVLVSLVIALQTPTKEEPKPPCEQVCSMQWGPEWTKCGEVKECQSYTELRYRQCVSACERDRQ